MKHLNTYEYFKYYTITKNKLVRRIRRRTKNKISKYIKKEFKVEIEANNLGLF